MCDGILLGMNMSWDVESWKWDRRKLNGHNKEKSQSKAASCCMSPSTKQSRKGKTMEILTGWWQQPGLGGGGMNGWSLCSVKRLCVALSPWVPVTPHLPNAIGCEYQKQTLAWTRDEGHNVPLVDTLCHLSHSLWQMNLWGAGIDIVAGRAHVQRRYFWTFR